MKVEFTLCIDVNSIVSCTASVIGHEFVVGGAMDLDVKIGTAVSVEKESVNLQEDEICDLAAMLRRKERK